MPRRKDLVTGEIYHIHNKSIANFKIFNTHNDFLRIKNMFKYYQLDDVSLSFSEFIKLKEIEKNKFNEYFISISQNKERLVQIIAYCIMPTHLHLILKQLKENGISNFMRYILSSYSHYFNSKYKRKGPLWESRFKDVLVQIDDQLLHLTRYVHLNPVTAYLVNEPEDWPASSYKEYLSEINKENKICIYDDILNIEPVFYKEFVENRISYQRELAKIKELLLE